MVRLAALLLFLVSMSFPATAQSYGTARPLAELPYRLDYNGLAIVQATINGEGPYDFIVDTGATMTVLFQNMLQKDRTLQPQADTRRVIGISSAEQLPVTIVPEIQFDAIRFTNLPTIAVADWDVEGGPTPQGIIGLDILENYYVRFDTDRQVILLYAAIPPEGLPSESWSKVELKQHTLRDQLRHIYVVTASIKGTEIPMIFDLGAEDAVINYSALRKTVKGVYRKRFELGGRGLYFGERYTDLFDNQEVAKLITAKRLVIGDVVWPDPRIVVFDAFIFDELGVSDRPFGMLGARIMLSRNFAMDFRNSRLLIGPETKKGPKS